MCMIFWVLAWILWQAGKCELHKDVYRFLLARIPELTLLMQSLSTNKSDKGCNLMVICTVIGVRPEFVKAAVLSPVIRKEHKEILIHTGQHYDANMSGVFFHELGLTKPDYMLTLMGDIEQERIDCMVRKLKSIVLQEKVDAVLIYGDTNTTLAGALVAEKLKIPAIHVEAGERFGLINNPEEQIRKKVDSISSLLLCTTKQAMKNLRQEGLEGKSRYIGNLMEISFFKHVHSPWHPHLISLYTHEEIVVPKRFYLLTCHRQENSNEACLTEILCGMESTEMPVIFPVHPRNKKWAQRICSEQHLRNIILTEPVGYIDSIHLIKNAVTVVTDSGGVLQEAHYACTPYVFVLDIPKAPENTRFDVSRLVKPERQAILQKVNEMQEFSEKEVDLKQINKTIGGFEEKVLHVLREFEREIINCRPFGKI